jgi:endoglucanase
MNGGRWGVGLLATGAAALALVLGVPAAVAGHSASARAAGGCADPDIAAPRDPGNPLALPTAPQSGDPLQGAHFFVDGPRHGQAAGAIASILGMNPMNFSDSDSWAAFKANHIGAINGNSKARLLSKIANQEETQNISLFAQNGGRAGIFAQTQKILCNNMSADPTQPTVPVLSTFFIYPNGQFCPQLPAIQRWQGTFKNDVNGMASAIGSKRAVILEEIDSIGASACLTGRSLTLWLGDLAYESKTFSKLPHAVTYAEAGYSDANGAGFTAARLWKTGVDQVRGFYTNGTHFAWSINEIRWAQNVAADLSQLSHGRYRAHFVVNTAQNGQGPKRNANIVTQGFENLCNPPGRGLGRMPTGDVSPTFDHRTFKGLDGFLWTGVPGRSHNSNCPNGPWQPGGVFDPRFALELAQHANQKLGPGFPSQPY